MIGNCADCKNHICAAKGISCTKVDEKQIINSYSEEEHKIMQAAAFVEATYYSQLTRLEETAEFARQMGYKKLGLAFCIGLNKEAHLIKKFLAKDFEVVSICCKNCAIAKDKLQQSRGARWLCNPKQQAQFFPAALSFSPPVFRLPGAGNPPPLCLSPARVLLQTDLRSHRSYSPAWRHFSRNRRKKPLSRFSRPLS